MLESNIEKLQLNREINDILKINKITQIKQLTNKTKTQLKEIGLLGYQISEVEVKLQLAGFDFKSRYKRKEEK